ncbi:MAG: hypothetical protein KGM42_13755 [Hyphomicrobiales bacterium]|nr:hypothetical protein [Hyphomicrobiales bacterium]
MKVARADLKAITDVVQSALASVSVSGKIGKKILQPLVAKVIADAGFRVDLEDAGGFLGAALPVWRDKNSGAIEPTSSRRLIDLVVYDSRNKPIALVETESDLDDLRLSGVTKRNGHYDVFSIARDAAGNYFDSYKSLERMAAAAFYASVRATQQCMPPEMVRLLAALSSDDPMLHNPSGLGILLVSGRSRPQDRQILAKRLQSLDGFLLSP